MRSDTPSVVPVEHSSCLWQAALLLGVGGVMTRLPLQALDSPSIAVRSGMSHIDAITSDLNPEVFLVLA